MSSPRSKRRNISKSSGEKRRQPFQSRDGLIRPFFSSLRRVFGWSPTVFAAAVSNMPAKLNLNKFSVKICGNFKGVPYRCNFFG